MSGAWRPAGDAEVRVGLIGLGSMGRNHLRVLGGLEGCRLVAVSDPMPEVLATAPVPEPIHRFADPVAMLDEVELDGVVIAAPTMAHVPLALAAIDHGVAVLVEKPLAATVEDAIRIVDRAEAAGIPVQVGHVERFNPAVLKLGSLLAAGALSTVYSISSRRAGPFPARIRDVGVTIDLATHDVDILSWIAGERPIRVYADIAQRVHASHEDLMFGLLHFPSGAVGMLDVNWLTPAKRRELVVVGEEGMFELDYLTQRLTYTKSDIAHPDLIAGFATTFTGDVAEIDVATHEPLQAELAAFVRVLRTGERPTVDGTDGLWAVAMANALLDAAARSTPVEFGGRLASPASA
jgi:UDP-N-acetylglucosamine 3-dehydrogenase